MPRRAPDAADTREKIVRAALALLREKGAKGLGQVQVARLAGVPQGHLTYYFPRKSDLLAAVARSFRETMHRDLLALAARAAAEGESPREIAIAFGVALIGDLGRTRSLLGLAAEADQDETLRAAILETIQAGVPDLATLLGRPADDVTLDLVLALAWGLEAQQLVRRHSKARLRAMVERLVEWIDRVPTTASAPEPRATKRKKER